MNWAIEIQAERNFLLARHCAHGDHTRIGASANSLVLCAFGVPGEPRYKPSDLSDLARCCKTFADAPWHLRQRMLPVLADWTAELREKYDGKASA